jgi:hypothetical protein
VTPGHTARLTYGGKAVNSGHKQKESIKFPAALLHLPEGVLRSLLCPSVGVVLSLAESDGREDVQKVDCVGIASV